MKPLRGKILIKLEHLTKTKSGIELPQSVNNPLIEKAKVLAIGEKVKKIKKGDSILFKSWALDNVEINDKTYSFIDEKDVLALS